MDIEKDFVWNEKENYAIIEKYVKKYKSEMELREGGEPERKETRIVIPSEYHGKPVREIFDAAFAMNDVIEEVVIPDSVEKIGTMVFNQCHSLKNISLGKGLKRLGFFAFHSTPFSEDESNYKNGFLTLDGWCACLKDGATEFNLPVGVYGLADNLLYYADGLKEVIIPENIKYVGMHCFSFNLDLDLVVIPDTVVETGDLLFGANVRIKKLVIPERFFSVQRIILRNGKDTFFSAPEHRGADGSIEVETTYIGEVELI